MTQTPPEGRVREKITRGVMCAILGFAWGTGGLLAQPAAEGRGQSAQVLTNAAQIRSLGPAEAQRGLRVEMRGMVTCFDPVTPLLTLQDDSGGIFLEAGSLPLSPRPGEAFLVRGKTSRLGDHASVHVESLTPVASGRWPAATAVSVDALLSGEAAAQWVELEGVIRSVRVAEDTVELVLKTPRLMFPATVTAQDAGSLRLGTHVRARGVCGYGHADGSSFGRWALLIPSLEHLDILTQPPEDLFAATRTRLGEVDLTHFTNTWAQPLHALGTVTLQQGDDSFFLQDATGGILVQPRAPIRLARRQQVEVVGWLDLVGGSPALASAVVRTLGSEGSIVPEETDPEAFFRGDYNNRLVRVRGRFLRQVEGEGDHFMDVEVGGRAVVGVLEQSKGTPPDLVSRSLVALTGINWVTPSGDAASQSFLVLVASPADIRVLAGPPWWTAQRALLALGVVGALGVAVLLWTVLLRRQVSKQTGTIREQVARETALRDRYEALVQNVNDGIILQDAETGCALEVNERVLELYGYRREEILGLDAVALSSGVAPHDRLHAQDRMQQALAGTPQVYRWEAKAKDGRLFWVEISMRRARIQGTDRLLVVVRDLTERIKAEQDLIRSEARYQDFVENFQGIAYQAEAPSFRLRFMAGRVREITGYAAEDFISGRTRWDELIHPGDLARVQAAMEPVLREPGRTVDTEYRIRHQDGSLRWIRDVARSGQLSSGCAARILHGSAYDITTAKQGEAARLKLEAQLRQAQKMEGIGQLASGVAHDFNNILTVIQGNAALLQSNAAERPESDCESLQEIYTAAERAATLTRQLLLFSRKKEIQLRPLDLNDLTAKLAKMLGRILGEDIRLDLRHQSPLPAIEADAGMMEQVLLNLAVNARDAMPNGGHLTIETSLRSPNADGDRSDAPAVCLSVQDTGCGIPPEHLNRIFEPFYTTKDVGKGTGLGLATVYGIVEQHHGRIEVESKLGRGSLFRIYLPCAQAAARPETLSQSSPQTGSARVLVVEDEAPVRLLVRKTLERNGFAVTTAEDGNEALRICREAEPRFDLVLTDMVMPGGLSGQAVVATLRQSNPGLQALFMSGYTARTSTAPEELREGENFIQKPFSPQHLLQLVHRILDRSSPS